MVSAIRPKANDFKKSADAKRRKTISGPKRRGIPPLRGLIVLAIVLVLWELLMHGKRSVFAPAPSQWWVATKILWNQGKLGPALIATFKTFFLALILAIIIGSIFGSLLGRQRFLDRMFGPLLEFCRVMPAAAIVPLAVLFAGYSQTMKVAVVIFAAIWPILLQVRSAARSLDPTIFDVGKVMHLSRWATFGKILFPSISSAILLGIRVAAPTVLIIVLLVELVTGITGVGSLIEQAQQNYQAAQAYGLLAMVGVIAVGINAVVAGIEAYALRYLPPKQ